MPDLRECIRLFHERERTRPPGTQLRIFRSADLKTAYWRQDVVFLMQQRKHPRRSPEVDRCRALARTGEHLGTERTGMLLEIVTEAWMPEGAAR